MAPPMCAARNIFERKTCLLVRSGGSCQLNRYVQKCTEDWSRSSGDFRDSGNGGYCPTNLCTHSGHALPSFPVQVVAWVAEGAFGRLASFEFGDGTVSWQLVEVVLNRKAKKIRDKGDKICISQLLRGPGVSVRG